jgi:hypothetical protein
MGSWWRAASSHLQSGSAKAASCLQVVKRVLVAGKLHPHEEQAGVVVVVLGGFFDVAAALQQKARHGVHDARRSGQERVRI